MGAPPERGLFVGRGGKPELPSREIERRGDPADHPGQQGEPGVIRLRMLADPLLRFPAGIADRGKPVASARSSQPVKAALERADRVDFSRPRRRQVLATLSQTSRRLRQILPAQLLEEIPHVLGHAPPRSLPIARVAAATRVGAVPSGPGPGRPPGRQAERSGHPPPGGMAGPAIPPWLRPPRRPRTAAPPGLSPRARASLRFPLPCGAKG